MGINHQDRRYNPLLLLLGGFVSGVVLMILLAESRTAQRGTKVSRFRRYPIESHIEDELFLGPQDSDRPPQRRPEYVYTTTQYQQVYDATWTQGGYPRQSCWGCRFATDVVQKLQFHTVLDAGTGNGALVRLLREHGKSAWGIELSKAVLQAECPDLLEKGIVEAGTLTNLPFADNQFDMVFSADVLEHIRPEEADKVISELVRVSRRHLFLSISLKGHTRQTAQDSAEANRHTLLRPRAWWEAKFRKHGAIVNRDMLWAMQDRDGRYTASQWRDCHMEGDGGEGGAYEVCVVDNTWLVGRREQANVRPDRCMTTSNQELEPWFFSFRKIR
ncbi:hypothetical protein WJX72_004952 [[Myrmecia] bisecta]|uniref:Methyltransferase type 11 domain-containing protein n=1 Tax=[Myrmecia] bisecta TaxID=41462 RepID=A0AAW1QQG8_9CHLO